MWGAQAAVDSAISDSAWSRLGTIVSATLGAVMLREAPRGDTAEGGMLGAAERPPAELRRDAGAFSTWLSASRIADSAVAHLAELTQWTSSRAVTWIPTVDQNDAWGHGFCIRADGRRAIIASLGPDAPAAMVCSAIRMGRSEMAGVNSLGLTRTRSGSLLVASRESHQTGSAAK